MRVIDEHEVRSALRRVAWGGELSRARRFGARRPELVAYLVASTRALSVEARAAAWRGFELACEAMGAAAGEPRATIDDVIAVHDDNLDFGLAVGAAHPRIADRFLAYSGVLRQRSLLRLLSDRIARSAPAGERGAVFLVLKTIVDILDGSARLGADSAAAH
jgi:hypothetical protein